MQTTVLIYNEQNEVIDRIVSHNAHHSIVRNVPTDIQDFPETYQIRNETFTRSQYVALIKAIAYESKEVAVEFCYLNSPGTWGKNDAEAYVELCIDWSNRN